MDAGFVFVILIAGNSERLHVISARMALRAGFGDVGRIYRREGIVGSPNSVDTVTTDAGCDPGFALLLQQLAVDTGVVLFFLVHPQRRIESFHEVGVAVAFAAVSRDVERLWLAEITFARILGTLFRVRIRIAAV